MTGRVPAVPDPPEQHEHSEQHGQHEQHDDRDPGPERHGAIVAGRVLRMGRRPGAGSVARLELPDDLQPRRGLVGLGIGLALADSSVVTLALPDILRQFDVRDPAGGLGAHVVQPRAGARGRARRVRGAPTSRGCLRDGDARVRGRVARLRARAVVQVLVGARCIQAVGGALLVCAALDLLTAIEGSDARAVRVGLGRGAGSCARRRAGSSPRRSAGSRSSSCRRRSRS